MTTEYYFDFVKVTTDCPEPQDSMELQDFQDQPECVVKKATQERQE